MKNWAYNLITIWYLWMAIAQFESFTTQIVRWSITTLLFIISIHSLRNWKYEKPPILIIILLIYTLLTCIWANDKVYAILRYIAFMQMLVWCTFAVPSMIRHHIISIENICNLALILSIIDTILIVYWGGNPIPFIFSSGRYSCGNTRLVSTGVAAVSMYSLPFLLFYINEYKGMGKIKYFLIILAIVNCLLLIASKGRAAIITTIVFIPLLLYLLGLRKYKLIFFIILLIIFLCCISAMTCHRTLRLDKRDITSNRLLMATLLWDDCNSRSPLIGCGNAMDRKFLEAYISKGTEEEIYSNPHNQFISVFYNWGWVGVTLFYGIIISILVRYINIFKYIDEIPENKYLILLGCYFFMQVIKYNNSGGLDSAGSVQSYMYWLYGGILLSWKTTLIKNNEIKRVIDNK